MGDSRQQPDVVDAKRTPPSSVRWRILALLMVYAALCHFNRISMSVAGTEKIMDQYHLSETEMGWVYSAYLIIYTLCMTPGGLFMDRYGARFALVLMGFGSALFAILTGVTGLALPALAGPMLVGLIMVRGLMGAVSAPIHPGGARLVGHWMAPAGRATANGLITAAAVIGIASVYVAFGALIDWLTWPLAFVLSGGVTAAVAVLWGLYGTERPEEHPGVNAQERDWIQGHEPAPATCESDSGFAVAPSGLIIITLSYGMLNYFEYLFFYWMQYYYKDVLELSKDTSRLYSTIPSLAMAAGMFLGGWLADRLQRRFGRRLGLALVPACGMVMSGLLLLAGVLTREPVLVVVFFSLAMAAAGASEGPFWTRAVELGGRRSGTAAAVMNTGGNAGGLLAPVLTPILAKLVSWQGGFGVAAALCMLGGLLWIWIHPPRSQSSDGK
jgi:sugar phosphate permease